MRDEYTNEFSVEDTRARACVQTRAGIYCTRVEQGVCSVLQRASKQASN